MTRRRPEIDLGWMEDAPCRHYPTWVFYPEQELVSTTGDARAICATCPLVERCLEHALTYPEPFGVWAGTTGPRRRHMRYLRQKRMAG